MHTATIHDVTPNSVNVDSEIFTYRRYRPHPVLNPYVEYYYVFRTHSEQDTYTYIPPQTLVPLNHPLLLFNIGIDLNIRDLKGRTISLPESIISGFGTGSTQFLPSPGVESIGVFFRPQGMGQLLNIPMSTLTNRAIDARDIFGESVKNVFDELLEKPLIKDKIKIIDSFLVSLLADNLNSDNMIIPILHTMYDQKGLLSIQDLSKQFQISRQHLYRIFIKSLGVSPKVFVRLLRFHYLINLYKRQPQNNWHDILYHSGFYDQAHMIREFTSIIGGPPTSVTGQNLFVSDFYIQS